MKANELMIGDWVLCFGQRVRVNCVASSLVGLEGLDPDTICKEGTVEPIPLTPEILEKNGFVLFDSSWWYGDLRISFGYSLVCGKAVQFKYVHELQHALRLCGIEKEIVL